MQKETKLNDKITCSCVSDETSSIQGNKRKLNIAKDRPPEAMGEQPSKAGFCHNETMKEETKP